MGDPGGSMRQIVRLVLLVSIVAVLAPAVRAGGGWVPGPGEGWVQLGYSRKQADTSWDSSGNSFQNTGRFENHDFRYLYLSGEFGLGRRMSCHYLVTYLNGYEGPDGDLERNAGPSDAWFGAKFKLAEGPLPMALDLEVRTPIFYDIDGPYERDLYDEDGNFLGHSPEWRGLLKHDVTLRYMISGTIQDGAGWWNADTGYTYREGAPADQIPTHADVGVKLPGFRSHAKISLDVVASLGNPSERTPEDRFGARPGFNFNDASMARIGVSWIASLTPSKPWWIEIGYNKWVWGYSARQYDEPFLSIGRSF